MTNEIGVTDAVHYAILSTGLLDKLGFYVNSKPNGRESSPSETYGVITLEAREHSRTLGKILPLSRCTFSIRLYTRNDGKNDLAEWKIKEVCNTVRNVRFERFLVKNCKFMSDTSDDKNDSPEKDKTYKFTKTITIQADIKEDAYGVVVNG